MNDMLEGWNEIGEIYPKLGDSCEIKTSSGEFYYDCTYDEDDDGGFFTIQSIDKTISAHEVTHINIKPKHKVKNVDELMEFVDGKLRSRVVYSMDKIKSDFNVDTGNLKGTLTQFEWGIQYSRKDLIAYKKGK
jgi:hypothetical protein